MVPWCLCTRLLELSGKSATFTSYPYGHCFGCKSIFHNVNPLRRFTGRVKDYYLSSGLGINSRFGDEILNLLYHQLIGKETSFSSSFFFSFSLSTYSLILTSTILEVVQDTHYSPISLSDIHAHNGFDQTSYTKFGRCRAIQAGRWVKRRGTYTDISCDTSPFNFHEPA